MNYREKQIRNRCTLLYDFICGHLNNGLNFYPPTLSHKYEISIRVEHNIYSSRVIEKISEKIY